MDTRKRFKYPIRIEWKDQSIPWWDEICELVYKIFGRPGEKFIHNSSENFTEFLFEDKKDATLCRLLLSDRI